MPAPSSARARPGRGLLALGLTIVGLVALMFAGGIFTPKLALDLAGGTTVIMQPVPVKEGAPPPTEEQLDQAKSIMDERVNGLGISEAEVALQGDNIVISVPGQGQKKVVELIGTTAKMDFRQVLATTPAAQPEQPTGSPQATPLPTEPENGESAQPSPSPTSRGRVVPEGLTRPQAAPTEEPGGDKKDDKKDDKKKGDKDKGDKPGEGDPQQPLPPGMDQQLGQVDPTGIEPKVLKEFEKLDCSPEKYVVGKLPPADPKAQIVACSEDRAFKYVLDKAAVEGTDLSGAQAGINEQNGEWQVNLTFNSKGSREWAQITSQVNVQRIPNPPRNQVAVVLDGLVQSAPSIQEPIPGGRAQITGSFTQQQAQDLAQVLQYGALPLKFQMGSIEEVSATLGGDQLIGGLTAGAIGFALIILYCLYTYRFLGLVAVSSLLLGGGLTYLCLVVLGEFLNYRLSLAGIAGLIVAIGITVDSFIVYFERIRDEMREGRTLRTAIERAWVRARRTIIVADVVQFLAAVVLYFLAVGGVAGFAFTLGLTTLIDVLIVFLFTKPVVTLLGRSGFYQRGHKLSGVDAANLGLKSARPRTAAGEA